MLATLDCISAAIELMRASDDAILKAADLSADNYNVILREDEAGL